VHGLNFTKLVEHIGRSSQHCTFILMFGYLAALSNAGGSNLSVVENGDEFCTFSTTALFDPPVKIRGG